MKSEMNCLYAIADSPKMIKPTQIIKYPAKIFSGNAKRTQVKPPPITASNKVVKMLVEFRLAVLI